MRGCTYFVAVRGVRGRGKEKEKEKVYAYRWFRVWGRRLSYAYRRPVFGVDFLRTPPNRMLGFNDNQGSRMKIIQTKTDNI